MNYPLFSHQQEAVEFAIKNNGVCALVHDCGLGKTRTVLEVFAHYRQTDPALKLLVVCPLSLIRAAWMADIEKFTSFTAAPYRDLKGSELPDIVIINYESLISSKILPAVKKMILSNPFMCILDESSRLKNNKSITTKVVLSLAPLFRYRLIASGTPCPNSELELWGQVRFLRSDVFDKSFYAFRNTYFHLEKNGQTMQQQVQGRVMNRMMMRNIMMQGWKYSITPFMREHIMHKIKPFTHWKKKEDALDLPEKVDQVREVQLSADEQRAYSDMKNHLVAEIGGQTIAAQVALAKISKLRECTAGFMYNADGTAMNLGKSKLNELEDTLEELGDQQVIIFIEFKHEVNMVKAMLAKKYGAEQVVTLYSETDDREVSIAAFQQGKARYLVCHPRSAAHGLTFVNASTMIFYSLSYSYEAYEQARNRIHRIGQGSTCLYIHLVAKNSIDEELLKVLQRKQSLQDAVYSITKGAGNGRNKSQECSAPVHQEAVSGSVHLQSGGSLHLGNPGPAA